MEKWKNGMMEYWNYGNYNTVLLYFRLFTLDFELQLECWNYGMMEGWNVWN